MFDQSDKPLEEKEFPDQADLDDIGEETAVSLRPCPACGEMIYDEAQQCPHCKEWLRQDVDNWRGSRKWYVRGGLYLAKVIVLNWFFWLAMAAIGVIVMVLEIL